MALDPNFAEQQRIIHELRVRAGGLVDREAVIERLAGGTLAAVAVALTAIPAFAQSMDKGGMEKGGMDKGMEKPKHKAKKKSDKMAHDGMAKKDNMGKMDSKMDKKDGMSK